MQPILFVDAFFIRLVEMSWCYSFENMCGYVGMNQEVAVLPEIPDM